MDWIEYDEPRSKSCLGMSRAGLRQVAEIEREPFHFQQANPFLHVENPLEVGKRLWPQGELANAILHFEAAAQKNPQDSEAWRCLGSALAEKEEEIGAIIALRQFLRMNPTNLDGLLSFAVTCANEMWIYDALSTLERWLDVNPAFQDVTNLKKVCCQRPMNIPLLHRRLSVQLERKFQDAGRQEPAGVDAYFHYALSVNYNILENIDRAIESLEAALSITPDDALLWNRLGANLANSDRPAEAVTAFCRALELYPGYIRARINYGFACLKLDDNRDTIEHCLSALKLQQRNGVGDKSQRLFYEIWRKLQLVVMRMGMEEKEKVELLLAAEKKDFDEFTRIFQQSSQ